jgi:hypothetical protein
MNNTNDSILHSRETREYNRPSTSVGSSSSYSTNLESILWRRNYIPIKQIHSFFSCHYSLNNIMHLFYFYCKYSVYNTKYMGRHMKVLCKFYATLYIWAYVDSFIYRGSRTNPWQISKHDHIGQILTFPMAHSYYPGKLR